MAVVKSYAFNNQLPNAKEKEGIKLSFTNNSTTIFLYGERKLNKVTNKI
jgi:hypothetical protein